MKKNEIQQPILPAQIIQQDSERPLSQKEEEFCDLYVRGGVEFAGRTAACYREIFGVKGRSAYSACYRLTSDQRIQARIREMTGTEQYQAETVAVKLQVAETLKAVMEEASSREYTDRFGVPLSPAPLRAVAVNAAKALMDIYPIKHTTESRLKIENGQGGVIFNVIVPQPIMREDDDAT